MTKKIEYPQSRHHIFIYDEDWKFLEQIYGAKGDHPLGVSEALRRIIHAKVLDLKAKAGAEYDRIRQQIKSGAAKP